ncbi:hypothetical protein PQO01_06885 [Lentisphaera marina]|uniref:hypothetical protein n=1 Tax=Lentisphaera marina TaxID=1111041 RepID=UPI0023654447|nr:hypothetical protein [Lentisphaera marina]MDD7984672.1 hypothetical protein [Lentisphaera marina]
MSDSNLAVRFCVIEGPAMIKGDKLIFTKIPVKAKWPIKITVAAYQWGRSSEPQFQRAPSIKKSFVIKQP